MTATGILEILTTARLAIVAGILCAALPRSSGGTPAILLGDFNQDERVTHADYTILGDEYGLVGILPQADADENGIVDAADFVFYRGAYGTLASPGPQSSPIGFTVKAAPFFGSPAPWPTGIEWTLSLSGIGSALAGHLNLNTFGPNIVSVQTGPAFLDDGIGPLNVPGINQFQTSTPDLGVEVSGPTAFVALGTTLSPTPPPINSTLEFARIVTAGTGPTTLFYNGEYGYQNVDYELTGSLTFAIPEPTSITLGLVALHLILGVRRNRQ